MLYILLTHIYDPKTTGNLTHRGCLPESHYFLFLLLISFVIPQNQCVSVRPKSIKEKSSLIKQMQPLCCPTRLSTSFYLIFVVWVRPQSFVNLGFFFCLFSIFQTSLSVPIKQEDVLLVTAIACKSVKLSVASGSATDYLHLGFLLYLLNTTFFF